MDRRLKKELGIVVAIILISALFFAFLVLSGDPSTLIRRAIVLGVTSISWIAILAYALSLLRSYWAVITLATIVPLELLLFDGLNIGSIGAALLLAVLIISARFQIQREHDDRIKFVVTRIYARGTRELILGFMVVLAGLSFDEVATELRAGTLLVPERYLELVIKPAEPIIRSYLPINPSQSIDELIREQIQSQTPGQNLTPEQEQQITEQLQAFTGTEVSKQDSLITTAANSLTENLKFVQQQYPMLATLILLATIVFIARLAVPILLWPTLGLIATIHQLALKNELSYTVKTNEQVERLQI